MRDVLSTIQFPVPLVGIAAFSGTGKTTLLLELVPLLKAAGLRIAVVKHAHHSFEMDQPGKDSYRLRAAGADEMLVAARCRVGWIRECKDRSDEPRLQEVLAMLDPSRLDLVLVEGFKAEPIPKIELHRAALGKPLLFPKDPNIVAIATDGQGLALDPGPLPLLALDDPAEVAAFVLKFIGEEARLRSNLAC
ncbi:MAG: molybdopterin-guanine dinucleotide biosynthesis protein B [Chromatiaceae bacterium]|nr:molybdopterin-guanine dinucleotide biosynthesis protein B [Chromatiaceae bacterium]